MDASTWINSEGRAVPLSPDALALVEAGLEDGLAPPQIGFALRDEFDLHAGDGIRLMRTCLQQLALVQPKWLPVVTPYLPPVH